MSELPVTWQVLIQRIGTVAAAAMVVGGGSMVLATSTETKLHEQRITKLEENLQKVPEIDRNVLILKGQLDVMNQKLDDARQAALVAAIPPKVVSK
jgi:hypothetical protein